ncbi:MAG TPA: hypothetical protein VF599_11740 [Pyrinomonadaceae bacterium]|jgi:hypothetical protein
MAISAFEIHRSSLCVHHLTICSGAAARIPAFDFKAIKKAEQRSTEKKLKGTK